MNLIQMIEALRCQMIEHAVEKGSFLDEKVIAISRELDVLLLRYQQQTNIQSGIAQKTA
jgi:hypothetical protein